MIIEQIDIRNFRAHRDTSIPLNPLTIFLGRNGVGKSSIIYAIENFYQPNAPISHEDFYREDTSVPIELCLTFGSLLESEVHDFGSYVRDGILRVTKRITHAGGRFDSAYFGLLPQFEPFIAVRGIQGAREKTAAFNSLLGTTAGLDTRAGSQADAERLMSEFERNHPELLVPHEKREQFFGAVGGGKLDNNTRLVVVPAVRDAQAELGRRGAIDQLVSAIVSRKIAAREDIQSFKARFAEEASRLYSRENLTELGDLAQDVSEVLAQYSPGAVLNLTWEDPQVPEMPLPAARPTLTDDSHECSVARKGHGLQRALVLSLLQYLAGISGDDGAESVQESETEAPRGGADLVLAIEEPELYLHPSRCRHLFEVLRSLVSADGSCSTQVIFATHSPLFVDLEVFDSVRYIRKQPDADGAPPCCQVSACRLENAAAEMERLCGRPRGEFTTQSFKAHAAPVMNDIVNEGFFADAIVVVEGLTEVGVLWALQQELGERWLERSIVVVPAGGKNNIDRPVVIFHGLGIPTYFIFDADRGQKPDVNERYLRMAGQTPTAAPPTAVGRNFAVFQDKIETEIRLALGDEVFESLGQAVAIDLGYAGTNDLLKNLDGAAQFVSRAYRDGRSVPILEEVVRAITRLVT